MENTTSTENAQTSVPTNFYFPSEPSGRRPIGLNMATLVLLRWIAVAGQTATLILVSTVFDFELPILPCALMAGALAVSNIALMLTKWRRLSEGRVALIMGLLNKSGFNSIALVTDGVAPTPVEEK